MAFIQNSSLQQPNKPQNLHKYTHFIHEEGLRELPEYSPWPAHDTNDRGGLESALRGVFGLLFAIAGAGWSLVICYVRGLSTLR